MRIFIAALFAACDVITSTDVSKLTVADLHGMCGVDFEFSRFFHCEMEVNLSN